MSTKLDVSKLSLMDALDLATLIEVEAFKRYSQFAERLGTSAEDDAASVFESMAVNENKHGEQIAERRIALFGDQRPRVKITDIFDVEAPDSVPPRVECRHSKPTGWPCQPKERPLRSTTRRGVTWTSRR